MNYDVANDTFRLAADLVIQGSENIFLTGKAGTGKTTFLKYIRENCPKQMAVVAPTGVAAINAGGVTIHSFFQLPLSPFIPRTTAHASNNDEIIDRHTLIGRLRFNKEKLKVLNQLELLIIDEVSMVRCDMMDAIDTVLRFVRKRPHEKFGGVQVLFIGDMYQLPPVIKEQEWKILSEVYGSPYFFDSLVIREQAPLYIEFNKIYRQSEERFIRLLNQVRNNEVDTEGFGILEERYKPGFRREEHDGYIILSTHNEAARQINWAELSRIDAPLFNYKAEVEGDFPANALPAEENLQLKVGAQVMFIKNDTERERRYFNGKIGIITSLTGDTITVKCEGDPEEIEVGKEKWENIRYTINKQSQSMDEDVLGSFKQYPLRLAWAITIHKSQGLTFEKAVIDAGEAFAPGQVYVALSRCTNLDGMVLQSKVRSHSLYTDPRIVQFSSGSASSPQLFAALDAARKQYKLKLLVGTFDFADCVADAKELEEYLIEHRSSFNEEVLPWIGDLSQRLLALQETASKFHEWMKQQFRQPVAPESNDALNERLPKAAVHFIKELDPVNQHLRQSPAVTDSRMHAKAFNDLTRELLTKVELKRFLIQDIKVPFDTIAWHKRRNDFASPPFTVNAYAVGSTTKSDSPHPVLHQQLRKLRDAICAKKDLPLYIVAGSATLDEMASFIPLTKEELIRIKGFGPVKVREYGEQFLSVIRVYAAENNLDSRMAEKISSRVKTASTSRNKKGSTRDETLRLYDEGLSPIDIARKRNLAISTIEGHLSYYVENGTIPVEALMDHSKLLLIDEVIREVGNIKITAIKQKLGDHISFGDIRFAIASKEYQDRISQGE
jgi:hypothetical protein